MFCVDNELADFVNFGLWGVLKVGSDNPAFVTIIFSPAGTHDWGFDGWGFHESLNDTGLVSGAEDLAQHSLDLRGWYDLDIITGISSIPIGWLSK